MAKCQVEKTVEVTLYLNLIEAKWLKDLLQNPVEEEGISEREIRAGIWHVLDGIEEVRVE